MFLVISARFYAKAQILEFWRKLLLSNGVINIKSSVDRFFLCWNPLRHYNPTMEESVHVAAGVMDRHAGQPIIPTSAFPTISSSLNFQ